MVFSRLTVKMFIALCGMAAACAQAGSAIYVSYGADGTPSFSSQPYDSNYRVFLRDDTPALERKSHRKASAQLVERREKLKPLIDSTALRHGVDPDLVRAVVHVESGFDARAVSPKGATGSMQLMPATAARYGVTNLKDPAQNLEGGVRYLKDLLTLFEGNTHLALAAYNAGENAVLRYARNIPPYKETRLYVPEVLTRYESYKQLNAQNP